MDHYDQKPWLKFYDRHVPPNLNYPEKSFWEIARDAFNISPGRVAFHYMGRAFTFKQVDDLSNRFANFLTQNGVKKGDIVGVNLPNLPAFYIAIFGIQKAGCVLTGVSPLLTTEELKHQLNDSGARALLTLDAFIPRWKEAVTGTDVKLVIATSISDYLSPILITLGKLMKKLPTAKLVPVEGTTVISFKEVIRRTPPDPVNVKVSMDDTCVIQYTGGTTGLPKGAELTQRNVVSQMTQINTWLDVPMCSEVCLTAFPLFHIAGLMICMSFFARGVTQIAVPNPRDLKFMIKSFKKYRPDMVGNVPTLYLELLKMPEFRALDFSRVKYFGSGAAPFPFEYLK